MSVVEEVKSRLDIVDVVSGYVPSLKKTGRTYKGLCPFHSEKTPSFVVFPDSQSWHCFGACGIGGDIFGFVMRHEGYDFGEALRLLATRAGVSLLDQSPEASQENQARKKLLQALATATAYFHHCFLSMPQAKPVRDYVAQRGLRAGTITKFQIGYAPNHWEGLKQYLLKQGYTSAELVDAGLLVEREDGSSSYDRFRHRLMIPIRNIQGQIIGFGARALADNQVPKYLNSPQSVLFDKSATLYALDVSKNAIRERGQAVIVEGYMDALQAHEKGFNNVVAQMGTALTEAQIKLLKRYATQLVLALDADTAGSTATLRGINVARQSLSSEAFSKIKDGGLIQYEQRLEMDIRIAAIPLGQDPDDVLKQGPEAWQQLISQAMPLVEYYIQSIVADFDLDTPKGKLRAVHTVIPILHELEDKAEQNQYLQQLAKLVKIDERTLRAELQRFVSEPNHPKTRTNPQDVSQPLKPVVAQIAAARSNLEERLLAILVWHPYQLDLVNQKLFAHDLDVLSTDDFLKTENAALFMLIKQWAITEDPRLETLYSVVDNHLEGQFATIVDLWYQQPNIPDEYIEREMVDLILRHRQKLRNEEFVRLQQEVGLVNDEENKQKLRLLTQQLSKLKQLDSAKEAFSITGRRRQDKLSTY